MQQVSGMPTNISRQAITLPEPLKASLSELNSQLSTLGSTICKHMITWHNQTQPSLNDISSRIASKGVPFFQKLSFYSLLWGATHGVHVFAKDYLISDPLAYLFPILSGAIIQGFPNCSYQKQIEKEFPIAALATGGINGLVCCLLTSTLLNPYLGGAALAGFAIGGDKLMCRIEGYALATCKRVSESGFTLDTVKNIGNDFLAVTTGNYVNRLDNKTTAQNQKSL